MPQHTCRSLGPVLVSLDAFGAFVPRCYARGLPKEKSFGLPPEPPVSACPNEPQHPSSCWVLELGWLHSEALSESSWRRRVVAVRLYSSLVAPGVMRTSSTRRTWKVQQKDLVHKMAQLEGPRCVVMFCQSPIFSMS